MESNDALSRSTGNVIGALSSVIAVALTFIIQIVFHKSHFLIPTFLFLFAIFVLPSKNKLQMILFLCVGALFFNIRTYFFSTWSYVNGRQIEYLSPAFFATDLVFLILIFYLIIKFGFKNFLERFFKGTFYWMLFLWVFLVSSILFNYVSSFSYLFFRFVLYLVYFRALLIGFGEFFRLWQKYGKKRKNYTLTFILLLLFSIGILQLVPYALYFLNINCEVCSEIGVQDPLRMQQFLSQVGIFGRIFVRNYGFFPHPNVLAGYATFALLGLEFLILFLREKLNFINKFLIAACFLVFMAVLLSTFSFSGLGAFVICSIAAVFFKIKDKNLVPLGILKYLILFVVLLISGLLLWKTYTIFKDPTSLAIRLDLMKASIELFLRYPLTGIGINQFAKFVVQFNIRDTNGILFLQPAHNIFLLLLTEYGLIFGGFLLFSLAKFVISLFKEKDFLLLIFLLPIVIIGMLDHYLVSLNQGILLTILVISIVATIHQNYVRIGKNTNKTK